MLVTKGKAITLQKRINKYREDLIRFVTHPACRVSGVGGRQNR